jgi:hypothetical protein
VTRLTDPDPSAGPTITTAAAICVRCALLSVEDDPSRPKAAFEAYARHAGSHASWKESGSRPRVEQIPPVFKAPGISGNSWRDKIPDASSLAFQTSQCEVESEEIGAEETGDG